MDLEIGLEVELGRGGEGKGFSCANVWIGRCG